MKSARTLLTLSIIVTVAGMWIGCNQPGPDTRDIKAAISKMDSSYSPSLGEIMNTGIQVHHAKLWFAGKNKNWELASYEENKIRKDFKKIQQYNPDNPNTRSIGMIYPAMDSVKKSIMQKDSLLFKTSFTVLTNTCNTCHQATKRGFNVITIPEMAPVFNQRFKTVK